MMDLIKKPPEKIKLVEINPHLSCHLCKGYYVDATTISECLHSFCRSCIIKFLHKHSYCPICEVIINKAKPNLKLDKTLQDIVYKLVPELFSNEMRRRQRYYQSHPSLAAKVTPEERGEDTERTIFNPRDTISLSIEYIGDDSTPGAIQIPQLIVKGVDSNNKNGDTADANGGTEENAATRRFLQCPGMCRIEVLKKFIRNKYNVDTNQYYIDILYKRVPLPDHYTLIDIAYIYSWKRNEPMKFFFKITDINFVTDSFDYLIRPQLEQEQRQQQEKVPVSSGAPKSKPEPASETSPPNKETKKDRAKVKDREIVKREEAQAPLINGSDRLTLENFKKNSKSKEYTNITLDRSNNVEIITKIQKVSNKNGLQIGIKITKQTVKKALPAQKSIKAQTPPKTPRSSTPTSQSSPEVDQEKSNFLRSIELTARNSVSPQKSPAQSPSKTPPQSPSKSALSPKSALFSPKSTKSPPNSAQFPPNSAQSPPNATQFPSKSAQSPPNSTQSPPYSAQSPPNATQFPSKSAQSPPNSAQSPSKSAPSPSKLSEPPQSLTKSVRSPQPTSKPQRPTTPSTTGKRKNPSPLKAEKPAKRPRKFVNIQPKPNTIHNPAVWQMLTNVNQNASNVSKIVEQMTPAASSSNSSASSTDLQALLFDSYKINIPSSLSVTVKSERDAPTPSALHKPVQNYIEILKLPGSPATSPGLHKTAAPNPAADAKPKLEIKVEEAQAGESGAPELPKTEPMDGDDGIKQEVTVQEPTNKSGLPTAKAAKNLLGQSKTPAFVSSKTGSVDGFVKLNPRTPQTFQKMFEEAIKKPNFSGKFQAISAKKQKVPKGQKGALNLTTTTQAETAPSPPGAKRNLMEIASKLYKKTKMMEQEKVSPGKEDVLNVPQPKKPTNKGNPPLKDFASYISSKSQSQAAQTVTSLHSPTLGLNYTVSVTQANSGSPSNPRKASDPPETSPKPPPYVPVASPKSETAAKRNSSPPKSPAPVSPSKKGSASASPNAPKPPANAAPGPQTENASPSPSLNADQILEKYNIQNLAQLTANFNFSPHLCMGSAAANQLAAIHQAMIYRHFEMQNHQNWLNMNPGPLVQYEKYLQSLSKSS